jgi:uncharacterized membrane protein YfcA
MKIVLLVSLGLAIGGLSGMLGIGGGVLLLPALVWLFDLKQPQAAGITLAVLAVPVTMPSVWQYYRMEVIRGEHLLMAAWIVGAFAVGGFLGATLHEHVPDSLLRVGFGLIMIYVAVRFILGSNHEVASAAAGVGAMALALLGYFGLRALGRRHLARPDLGQHIREAEKQGRGDIEYHI